MKVVFKGSQYLYLINGYLTIDKVYTVTDTNISGDLYYIKCDNNNYQMINKKYFVTLDEHRDKIINSIIDETSIQ
jgi:hypothetical protein